MMICYWIFKFYMVIIMIVKQEIKGQVCIKLYKGDYEISIAVNDSCKMCLPTTMFRSDIRIYKNNKDMSTKLLSDSVITPCDFDTLLKTMIAIKELDNAQN